MDNHKLSTTFLLFFLLYAIANIPNLQAHARAHHQKKMVLDPGSVEEWFKKLPNAKQKITRFHFYFQDIVSGKNPSVATVARANFTTRTGFGLVRVMDDPLTERPEPDSKVVGRAQGIYAVASLDDVALLMTLNYVFTDGPYNGSTLSLLGHNPILHKYREIPILGGSGVFRLARGVATARTVRLNMTTQDATVEYNVIVLHY